MMRDTCVFAVSGREHESLGDLVVRQPLADEPQHLALAVGERGQALGVGCVAEPDRHPLEQAPRDARREQRLTARDHAHGPDEVDGLGVLHEEAARAGADRREPRTRRARTSSRSPRARPRAPDRPRSARSPSSPSPSGMRMSMSTTSTGSRRTSASSSSPLDASPTTSMSGSACSSARKPARTSSWSSASATRITASLPTGAAPSRACRRAARRDLHGPAERARRARACRGCRCPRASRRTPAPSSSTVTRSSSPSALDGDHAPSSRPACRTTLVRASCTMR